ncbi:MAG: hypothetical protein HC912_05785 [Saprospiraceae bacterium]|nr:hypothetical protein [Saprospiraceae bacterium]
MRQPDLDLLKSLFQQLNTYATSTKRRREEKEEMAAWIGYLINVAYRLHGAGTQGAYAQLIAVMQFGWQTQILNLNNMTEDLLFSCTAVACHQSKINNELADLDPKKNNYSF